MPVASVVVPCYNAERFLQETVASAQAQTVRDIEIVCVNDGSTDGTLELLRSIARDDKRVRVIDQPNGGEGPARDAGLCAATGDWLYFLDSDDLMEPTLLEEAIAACEKEQADVVVFQTILLDQQTGEERVCGWSFERSWMPDDSFVPAKHPDRVFNSFQNWVHNKVFRGSFVREHDLRMQHIHRTADLLFTCRALAQASRVALLEKPLHKYRVNNPQSAMQTSDAYPLDFYDAFVALRSALEEAGLWNTFHDSFVNWAIEGVFINLRVTRSLEGFLAIVHTMRKEGLDRLDIRDFPREKSDMEFRFNTVHGFAERTDEEVLYGFLAMFKTEVGIGDTKRSRLRLDIARRVLDQQTAWEEVRGLKDELATITGSMSFKIGRAITAVPRKLRDLLHRP